MALGAIALGVASAASGVLGAIGSQNEKNAAYKQQQIADQQAKANWRTSVLQQQRADQQARIATDEANQSRSKQFEGAINNWEFQSKEIARVYGDEVNIFNMKKDRFKFQVEENSRAAADAYYRNSVRLNEIVDRSKGQALDSYISMLEANAESEVRGQSGRRKGMRAQANLMQRGMEMRRMADNLALYGRDTTERNKDITRRLKIDNQNTYFETVAVRPSKRNLPPPPVAPVMSSYPLASIAPAMPMATAQRPSSIGMYGSILNSTVGGFMTTNSLLPKGLFG